MSPSPLPVSTSSRWRRWTSLSVKAAIAIAALTALAQWTGRFGSETTPAAITAAREVADPVTTGSLGHRNAAPVAKPAELDQHGLTSLVSQVQGGSPAPKAAPAKKR